jgi:hypothetical protein
MIVLNTSSYLKYKLVLALMDIIKLKYKFTLF